MRNKNNGGQTRNWLLLAGVGVCALLLGRTLWTQWQANASQPRPAVEETSDEGAADAAAGQS